MKNYYLSRDAGQLFIRNRYIESLISSLKNEINLACADDINFLFGKLDALTEGKGKLHKTLVEEIVEIKQKISAAEDEDDLFNEITYLKGYILGIEEILNYDRKIFDSENSFILFVYSISEELISKYKLALSASDLFTDSDEINKVRYRISTSADEICESIVALDENTEFAICVIYDRANLPSKEIMQQLSFGRNTNVYLLHDNESMKHSVDQIIKKMVKSTII